MSKKAVSRAVAIYFGVAAALALFVLLTNPESADTRTAVNIGSFLGIAVLTPALAGILPLIFWAFGRFRPYTAPGPIIAWVFIGALFMIGGMAEEFYEGKLAISNIPTNISAFFSNDTQTFIRVVKTSCVKRSRPKQPKHLKRSGLRCLLPMLCGSTLSRANTAGICLHPR